MKSEFAKNMFLFVSGLLVVVVCGLVVIVGFITQLNFFAEAITYPVYSQNACYEFDDCEEMYGNAVPPNFDYYFSFAGSELLLGDSARVEGLGGVKVFLIFFELIFLTLGKKLIWDRHYKVIQI